MQFLRKIVFFCIIALISIVLFAFSKGKLDIQPSSVDADKVIEILDDSTFISECLNLDYVGLEKVKSAVSQNDYDLAGREYVAYLKSRRKPVWNFDWRDFYKETQRDKKINKKTADEIADNNLTSVGVSYHFGDDINWKYNPSKPYNKEWTWQLNRHSFWAQLGNAYWATGDEKYAKSFVRQLRDWINDNPRVPENFNAEYSTWRTIEAGIRMLGNWPNAFYRFLGSPNFDDKTILLMVKSFYEHGQHLRVHSSIRGNWVSMEMNGLYHVAVLFPEFKQSMDWEKYAVERMLKEETEQVYPDGAQKELTPSYHGVTLTNFCNLYSLAKLNNRPIQKEYVQGLERMFEYYQKVRMPDGTCPALNDCDWDMNADSYLRKGFSFFPRRKDFLYSATFGGIGTKPEYTSIWMPWAGWYVMRSGWGKNDLYSIFEVGPYSMAHSHEDNLSFIISAYGNLLLTEGGSYTYDTSEWRKYVLSARAHNVTRVDNNDQNRDSIKKRKGIRWLNKPLNNRWLSTQEYDYGEGWYNEGFGAKNDATVKQCRSILFIKKLGWVVFDIFSPSDDRKHKYESAFHLNSDSATVYKNMLSVVSHSDDKATLQIMPIKNKGLSVNIIKGQKIPEYQGWMHKNDYECIPVATPIFLREAKGQWVEPYFLLPRRIGSELSVVKVIDYGNYFRIRLSDGTEIEISYQVQNNRIVGLSYKVKENSTGKVTEYNLF